MERGTFLVYNEDVYQTESIFEMDAVDLKQILKQENLSTTTF